VTLRSALALEMLRCHPIRSALELERAGVEPAADLLARAPAEDVADVIAHLSSQFAAAVCARLPEASLGPVFESLPFDVATRLVRIQGEDAEHLLDQLPERVARDLAAATRYPDDTAGGLMDPRVLALPAGLSAGQAIERLRELSEHARYNVYIVDADDVLVGVLNLRELFLAAPGKALGDLMVRDPQSIKAYATRSAIVAHPGWRLAHALPVIDEKGRYLGALRYRTLRMLEADAAGDREPSPAGDLGELFGLGAGAALHALTAAGDPEGRS